MNTKNKCPDLFNCLPDVCPDFLIKRHDTQPNFQVSVTDCDGPLDLTDENLVLEANMWTKGKLKKALDSTTDHFQLADNIGFHQIMIGDIILIDRVRLPEYMLVIGFDEDNQYVRVERGYHASPASSYKKGQSFKIFRFMNSRATITTVLEDIDQEDGEVAENQLIDTLLVFEWGDTDTCLPGCYWLEFKLLQMTVTEEEETVGSLSLPSVTPSFTPSTHTPFTYQCSKGVGVDWVRRFPVEGEGFMIRIENSFTHEL